ncbi:hypothetical protein DCCM_4395 [Desulfocucumis palustris]|uniref:Uncharacterized protein n=1 Tax=Desulfocucumis palustris TaxID=1898651 RepID=A0A2L2XGK1_9FIRM|nr:hypothetical protein DCCM_4395 [Desulfocucumis palustris]
MEKIILFTREPGGRCEPECSPSVFPGKAIRKQGWAGGLLSLVKEQKHYSPEVTGMNRTLR